jgi:GT2 family glycosyltransferase
LFVFLNILCLTLSVIIVNYNVTYFLEQCLYALQRAVAGLQAEIIVVDNGSTDGSLRYLQPRFPTVVFIESSSNAGFAKGCNMGFLKSSGSHILFLNPDTIIGEDTLHICINFFKTHADAGALGVRMIDGSGRFLKESKRSFPAPLTAFFKLAGMARLFPHSPVFSRYHLGHLDAHKNHEVDVLAGAFMMVRRTVLEKVGLFDETFFMYGEDVDLSYRIQKSGYKNYYLAETEIIHFKGESTRRGSLNYVRLFYSAMSTFVRKHYGGNRAAVFNFFIHLAIWLRAAASAVGKVIGWIGLPLLDAALFLFSFWVVKEVWVSVVKPQTIYPHTLLLVLFPSFTLVYLAVAYYAGLYDRQYKRSGLLRAAFIATLVLLALYALLPEQYRFSRGILLFGALLAAACMSALRWVLSRTGFIQRAVYKTATPDVLVAGTVAEYEEIEKLVQHNGSSNLIGRLSVAEDGEKALGSFQQAQKLASALNARELILCSGAACNKQLIRFTQTVSQELRLRFHAAGSGSIVGSDSSTASGEAFSPNAFFTIALPRQRRLKRLFDGTTALFFLFFFPLHVLFVRHPLQFLKNAVQVLAGRKTWIGYAAKTAHLPPLRKAVLTPEGEPVHEYTETSPAQVLKKGHEDQMVIDFWYAKHYEPVQDLKLIVKNYRHLGS